MKHDAGGASYYDLDLTDLLDDPSALIGEGEPKAPPAAHLPQSWAVYQSGEFLGVERCGPAEEYGYGQEADGLEKAGPRMVAGPFGSYGEAQEECGRLTEVYKVLSS